MDNAINIPLDIAEKQITKKVELYEEVDPELHFGTKIDEEYDLKKKMLEDHTYPSPSQEDFQKAIYEKRDYAIHTIPYRGKLKIYDEIKEYRDNTCPRETVKFSETQVLLSNFINPNTPYRG